MTSPYRNRLPSAYEPNCHRWRRKIVRQWRWVRREGFSRLVEEGQLNPVARWRIALSKSWWRFKYGGRPGEALPVFLVGVQRSGTNMLVRGLEEAPQFEVHSENDATAFRRYRLRGDERIAHLIESSRHKYVLFKPLCDSHRTDELLDSPFMSGRGKAIWAYRDVDGRVRSAISKFGDVNHRVLRDIAHGQGLDRWQAQRLSSQSLTFIRSFNYSAMSEETAAALFWYVRNSLFFDLGLDSRSDIFLLSYDALVDEPEIAMRRLCAFLDFPYHSALTKHIQVRPNSKRPPLEIDTRVRDKCDELAVRLETKLSEQMITWAVQD